jgi:hypothetical protein
MVFRHILNADEQNGFADTSQTNQDRALSRRLAAIRWSAIRASSSTWARPANSGGGFPAPGANGFLTGSI